MYDCVLAEQDDLARSTNQPFLLVPIKLKLLHSQSQCLIVGNLDVFVVRSIKCNGPSIDECSF